MVKNTIKFLASTSAPNPKEVDYWVDTMEDPAGAIIKVFRNNKWEPLNDTPEGYKELENKVDVLDKEVGKVKEEISKFGSAQCIVELQIGNSDEVKEANIGALQDVSSTDHTFFVDIDYGYGTGQWLPSVGGSAFIITSEGHAVAYTIGSDGAVIKSAEFSLSQVDWYGVSWNDGDEDPKLVRIGNLSLHKSLPIQSAMRGCVVLSDTTGVKDGTVLYLNDDWSGVLANNGIDVDLTKENIMVEIPEYWYIDEYTPETHHHELKISARPQAGWFKHKKSYVSAYEGFVDENGVYKSLKGQIPTVKKSRTQFRTAVRLNGPTTESKWNIYTYAEHRAICHLFMVEYATRYSQDAVKTLDSNGYHQGGLGEGCTTGVINVNGVKTYAFIPTGSSDVLGNGTGEVLVQVTSTEADGTSSTTSKKCNRYRGIENPFGHVYKYCDDVISTFDTNTQKRSYFMCEDPSKFSTNYTNDYKFLCIDDAQTKSGLKITVVPTTHGDLFTMNIINITNYNKHWTDYNYDSRTEGERCLLIGGDSYRLARAGLVCFDSSNAVGTSDVNIGCRVVYNI